MKYRQTQISVKLLVYIPFLTASVFFFFVDGTASVLNIKKWKSQQKALFSSYKVVCPVAHSL